MSVMIRNEMEEVNWKALTMSDRYLFASVMQNKELCRGVIERLLKDNDISNLGSIVTEKEIKAGYFSKGIRLDVHVYDNNQASYNLELQAKDTKELHKRSRYYSSAIDTANFRAGENYIDIRNNYVIFICQEDIFGLGLWRYSFENRCTEAMGLTLNDGAHKIFFNMKGYRGEINPEAKAILEFIEGKVSDDPFVQKLEKEVERLKNNEEWRMRYMDISWVRDKMDRADARREGRAEGKAEGKVEGRAEVVENAKVALEKGLALSEVMAQITGLSIEKINELTA